jgi:hypothetical protein
MLAIIAVGGVARGGRIGLFAIDLDSRSTVRAGRLIHNRLVDELLDLTSVIDTRSAGMYRNDGGFAAERCHQQNKMKTKARSGARFRYFPEF